MNATVLLSLALVWGAEPVDVKPNVTKGLEWLAGQQAKEGNWSENGQFPTALTAFAGTALMMQGSTTSEGKYAPHLRKAVAWFEANAQPNGLLQSNNQTERGRYILGHGYAMMFLASVYAEEQDETRRKRLQEVLRKAVDFAATAQTRRGGWGYVTAAEGSDFDEGHSTVVMMLGLREARNAGLPVPRLVLDRAKKYFEDATNAEGGVLYSLAQGAGGAGRPVITAGVAAVSTPDAVKPGLYASWVRFVAKADAATPPGAMGSFGLLQYFYFARVAHRLGEEGHKTLDPNVKDADLVRWSVYRERVFGALQKSQQANGTWNDGSIGPVFGTSLALIALQQENEPVPTGR